MNRQEAVDHYISIYQEFTHSLSLHEERMRDPNWPTRFGSMNSVGTTRLGMGIVDYLAKGDVASFRSNMSESAALRLRMYELFEAGEKVDPSYVSMLGGYKAIYKALAAGDFALAEKISAILGGRDKIEKENDHPFTYTMGYLLKSFIDDDGPNEKRRRIEDFRGHAGKQHCSGHLKVFEAILEEDNGALPEAFAELLAGHKKSASSGGFFADELGDVLSIWGIGLANFARHRGLTIEVDDPFIPADLLI